MSKNTFFFVVLLFSYCSKAVVCTVFELQMIVKCSCLIFQHIPNQSNESFFIHQLSSILRSLHVHLACIQLVSSLFVRAVQARCTKDERTKSNVGREIRPTQPMRKKCIANAKIPYSLSENTIQSERKYCGVREKIPYSLRENTVGYFWLATLLLPN